MCIQRVLILPRKSVIFADGAAEGWGQAERWQAESKDQEEE